MEQYYTHEVCFSPPGPGQCQPWHEVAEPNSALLFGLALAIAWIWRPKSPTRL